MGCWVNMVGNTNQRLQDAVLKALSTIQDPDLGKDIVSLGFIKNLLIEKTLLSKFKVSFDIELTTPACPVKDQLQRDAQRAVEALHEVGEVRVRMTAQVRPVGKGRTVPGVRTIIAVGSGKGGVGKSTVAVNLALALKAMGARVALLDADVYGPSLAAMLGLSGMPKVKNGRILPMEGHGIPCISFAFFAPIGEAVIWRGPQIAKAVEQMLFEVDWAGSEGNPERADIDYLLIDLPPGTGDVHLTVAKSAPLAGAVLVSTPQDIAMLDTLKGLAMFERLNVPVLGLVENMSGFLCPHCDKVTEVFGSGGAERKAAERGVPFLGRLPLHPLVVEKGDRGVPIVAAEPTHPVSRAFERIASEMARNLSKVSHATPSDS
jgi:ATP-binding protein involved in chromosome partitioning